jgi:AhpD family alkylhydroperoxidase
MVAANEKTVMNHSPIDYATHAPEAFQHLLKLSGQLHKGPLGHKLVELISLRVSQINGCVYCLDMHSAALRKAGVAQRTLDTLPAWRESPLFNERERAALGWAEALNRIGMSPIPEDALDALRPHFDEREISELTFTVAMITAWNMLNVGLHKPLPEAV